MSPEAAEVYLDGTYIGCADDFDGYPDYLYLEPGKYRLEFRHPAYETLVKELDVQNGERIRLNDEMTLLPGKGRLSAVDPERRGTPLGRVFGRGDEARRERGAGRTGRFEANEGARPVRGDDLEDLDELDEFDADAGDDEVEEVPPPIRQRAPASPVSPKSEARKARPEAESTAPLARGHFRFDVEPADAAVYLDDRYVGTAEELAGRRRGLPVTAGKHTVTVVRPGYGSKTVDVESKPGVPIDVVIELEK